MLLITWVLLPLAWAGSCDCSCCVTTSRMPSEVINGVEIKCGMPSPDLDQCGQPETCTTGSTDTVLAAAAGGDIDYGRFCFFECKVPAVDAAIGSECNELTSADIARVTAGGSGNAMDLAIGQENVASSSTGGDGSSDGSGDASGTEEVVTTTTIMPGLDLAAAGKVAAAAARTEARAAAAEAKAAKATMDASRSGREARLAADASNGLVANLRGQVAQARLHARSAANAAKETKAALAEVQAAAHEAAVAVGKQAADEMQGEADSAKRQLASMIAAASVPPPPEIPESVTKVMGPYYAAAGRAMTTMGIYSDQAQQMTKAAGTMRQQARGIAQTANTYQAAGDTANAAGMLGTANDLMGKADGMAASATQYQDVAASINSGLPAYENARAAAGARAAYWANLPGMIPPPVPS